MFGSSASSGQSARGVVPKGYMRQFVPGTPIVVEAGAHVGSDTIEMSKIWPGGTIHAFEPIPDLFRKLKENTSGLKNVRLYPCALSDSTGVANMFVSRGSSDGSSSLLLPKEHLSQHPTVYVEEIIEVPTITLSQWAIENNVGRVDLLWLDMQGYELAMLKASGELLRTVSAVYTEVSLKELYQGTPLYPMLREWLEGEGFKVEREELAWVDAGNVLFVRGRRVR
jgi:FkbM family methyltransferase